MREAIGRFASTTLAGDPLVVPDDLIGPTVLVFAYRQRQQRDVDTWIRSIHDRSGIRLLEVPVLGRRWLPVRRFIDGGMASDMDAATRARTMCLYTDVAAFRRSVLGVASRRVLAVLVDPRGQVRWHAFGPASEAGARDLRRAVSEAIDDPS